MDAASCDLCSTGSLRSNVPDAGSGATENSVNDCDGADDGDDNDDNGGNSSVASRSDDGAMDVDVLGDEETSEAGSSAADSGRCESANAEDEDVQATAHLEQPPPRNNEHQNAGAPASPDPAVNRGFAVDRLPVQADVNAWLCRVELQQQAPIVMPEQVMEWRVGRNHLDRMVLLRQPNPRFLEGEHALGQPEDLLQRERELLVYMFDGFRPNFALIEACDHALLWAFVLPTGAWRGICCFEYVCDYPRLREVVINKTGLKGTAREQCAVCPGCHLPTWRVVGARHCDMCTRIIILNQDAILSRSILESSPPDTVASYWDVQFQTRGHPRITLASYRYNRTTPPSSDASDRPLSISLASCSPRSLPFAPSIPPFKRSRSSPEIDTRSLRQRRGGVYAQRVAPLNQCMPADKRVAQKKPEMLTTAKASKIKRTNSKPKAPIPPKSNKMNIQVSVPLPINSLSSPLEVPCNFRAAPATTTGTSTTSTYSTAKLTATRTTTDAFPSISSFVLPTSTPTPQIIKQSAQTVDSAQWLPLIDLFDQRLELKFMPLVRDIANRQQKLETKIQSMCADHENKLSTMSARIQDLGETIAAVGQGNAVEPRCEDEDTFEVRYEGLPLSAPVDLGTVSALLAALDQSRLLPHVVRVRDWLPQVPSSSSEGAAVARRAIVVRFSCSSWKDEAITAALRAASVPMAVLFDGVTDGPNSFTGPIGKALKDCQDKPVADFRAIDCQLPDVETSDLSQDQKYMLKMAKSIKAGHCTEDLLNSEPGNLNHAQNLELLIDFKHMCYFCDNFDFYEILWQSCQPRDLSEKNFNKILSDDSERSSAVGTTIISITTITAITIGMGQIIADAPVIVAIMITMAWKDNMEMTIEREHPVADPNLKYIVTSNASQTAIGGYLAQMKGKIELPIGYVSRALTDVEQSYLRCTNIQFRCFGTARVNRENRDELIEIDPHAPSCPLNLDAIEDARFKEALRHAVETDRRPLREIYDTIALLSIFTPDISGSVVCSTAVKLFYSSVDQHTSVGNYWNDPHHQKLYYKYSQFLPFVNNEKITTNTSTFKEGLTKLQRMVLIGGPDNGIITPWQSSQFGYYNVNETVGEMRDRDEYQNDLIGLKTLDKNKKLILHTVPGIPHFMWRKNMSIPIDVRSSRRYRSLLLGGRPKQRRERRVWFCDVEGATCIRSWTSRYACHPRSGNLLVGRKDRLSASSTCGQSGPVTYYIHSSAGPRDGHVCDKSSSRTQHEIDNIVSDGYMNKSIRHLQIIVAPRVDFLSRGSRAHASPMIQLRSFIFLDLIVIAGGNRRAGSRTALPADLSLHGGNIDETYAHMQITNLRVNLSEFPPELESDKKPDGAYYAISEMIVRGLCSCHGHSSHCLGSEMDLDMVGSTCICEHNNVVKYCEQCKSQYRDAPWRRAQGYKTNACQVCRCNGHSRQCRFDARLYEKTGCGGVCEN
ncbi:unnamed protein product [Trichogramma brassicae]|uniref:Laminin N-terminal domain-containing protein n=1 Tax=Trichogramma brassicae TaxID=86971 RepID=A0A6H5ILA5_9HYME|nr:unnamed protein product [Trichogramma brassicae]